MDVFNANCMDPDQTPRSVASDLDPHCLPMSFLWDPRHKWVNAPQGQRLYIFGLVRTMKAQISLRIRAV